MSSSKIKDAVYYSHPPKIQKEILKEFDVMKNLGLIQNYHRDVNTPFSFILTKYEELIGNKLTGKSINFS
mgnify:CR=1 FL=1